MVAPPIGIDIALRESAHFLICNSSYVRYTFTVVESRFPNASITRSTPALFFKILVANVILNRVRSGHYPGTVSGVVYQRSQFSGVSDGAGNPSDRFAARLANGPRNTECMQAALEALSGVNNIGGYTSFRALYTVDVNNYSDFVIIGDHIFH